MAESQKTPRHSRLALLATGAGAYVLLVLAVLPYLIPPAPRSRLGWVLLLLVAPPLYLLMEWLAERISGSRWTKPAKALVLIVLGFVLVVVQAMCSAALR